MLELGAPVVDLDGKPLAPVAMVLETDSRNPAAKHQILQRYVERGLQLPIRRPWRCIAAAWISSRLTCTAIRSCWPAPSAGKKSIRRSSAVTMKYRPRMALRSPGPLFCTCASTTTSYRLPAGCWIEVWTSTSAPLRPAGLRRTHRALCNRRFAAEFLDQPQSRSGHRTVHLTPARSRRRPEHPGVLAKATASRVWRRTHARIS